VEILLKCDSQRKRKSEVIILFNSFTIPPALPGTTTLGIQNQTQAYTTIKIHKSSA
jgi:hypothetical protein